MHAQNRVFFYTDLHVPSTTDDALFVVAAIDMNNVHVGVGWTSNQQNVDVDSSCVLFDRKGNFVDAVYFGNKAAKTGG